MSRVSSSLLLGVVLLAGCTAPVRLVAPRAPLATVNLADGFGHAQVSVRWPDAPRQVQAIPQAASLAYLEILDASQSLVASASVQRAQGVAQSSLSLDLPVGLGYAVTVRLDAPPVSGIAAGRSLAFEVRRNQIVTVPITVEPVIKTFFGPLTAFNANGGTTSAPGFARPWSVAVGGDDTVYYADFSSHAIRAVSQDGAMRVVVGQVTDTSTQSQGIASTVSPDNSGDEGPATSATCRMPHGVYVAPNGDLYFADTLTTSPANIRLRMVPASSGERFGRFREAGYVYTLRTIPSVFGAAGMVQDRDGSLLFSEQGANAIWRLSADGATSIFMGDATGSTANGLAPAEVSLLTPWGLTLDERGNLFFSEYNGSRVRMLCRESGTYFGLEMTSGRVYTIFDGPQVQAALNLTRAPKPRQIAVDRSGNCYVVDNEFANNAVYRVDRAGRVSMLAGGTKTPNNSLVVGDEGLPASASFNLPTGLAIDSRHRLYVGDTYNGRIRWIHL